MTPARTILLAASVGVLAVSSRAENAGLARYHGDWPPDVFHSAYRLVASPAEWEQLNALPARDLPRYLDRFWKKRDPTPSTDRNEFEEQFRARVEYALQWFNTVSIGRPWDDRGDVYIRLGPPDDRQQGVDHWYSPTDTLRLHLIARKKKNPFGIQKELRDSRENGTPLSGMQDGEVWRYFSRNLTLQFQSTGLDCRQVPAVDLSGVYQTNRDFQEVKYAVDTTTPVYRPPLGTEYRAVALDGFPFRRADGNYDFYLGCTFPASSFQSDRGVDSFSVDLMARVTVLDSTFRSRWADSTPMDLRMARADRSRLVQMQWAATLPPGLYIATVEITDRAGVQRAVCAMDRWLVPYADSVHLDLSPLVLASDIESDATAKSTFSRGGKRIQMTPGRVFTRDQDVFFYHEVYNLAKREEGPSSYSIVYTLYDETDREARVLKSQTFESNDSWVFQSGRIPGRALKKGSYILEVKTTDLLADVTRTALANFEVQ